MPEAAHGALVVAIDGPAASGKGTLARRLADLLHGRLDLKDLPEVYRRWSDFGLVSISDDQRKPLAFANWTATVHHGMPGDQYRFSAKSDGYLAFLGRISPEKRPDRAIEIATRLNKPLKIAAKIDAADRAYWEAEIEPLVRGNPLVEFVGEIGDTEKSAFLGGAEALLFPIDWPEPFGLVMIEAMACGTPVVAFACGSTPEIIEDGATGFLVSSMEEAVAAAAQAHRLDREAIRARFDLRFSATAMARRYLDVYADLLAQRPFAAPMRTMEEERSFAALA